MHGRPVVPAVVPTSEGTAEPLELSDEVWRDPSLVGATTTSVSSDRTQVIHIVDPPEAAAAEAAPATEPATASSPGRKRSVTAVSSVNQSRRRREVPRVAPAPGGPPSDPEEPNAPDVPASESHNQTIKWNRYNIKIYAPSICQNHTS